MSHLFLLVKVFAVIFLLFNNKMYGYFDADDLN